jgi:hypothetical protein
MALGTIGTHLPKHVIGSQVWAAICFTVGRIHFSCAAYPSNRNKPRIRKSIRGLSVSVLSADAQISKQ